MKENRNYRYRNRRHRKSSAGSSLIATILTGIASYAANDLMSENSKIKQIFKNIIEPKKIPQTEQEAIEAKFSVLDEKLKDDVIQEEMND